MNQSFNKLNDGKYTDDGRGDKRRDPKQQQEGSLVVDIIK
jgi:hypothetical protein